MLICSTILVYRPSFYYYPRGRMSAHIAQSVEHFLGKEEVTGSNPVMSSIDKKTVQIKEED